MTIRIAAGAVDEFDSSTAAPQVLVLVFVFAFMIFKLHAPGFHSIPHLPKDIHCENSQPDLLCGIK
jgi:hypothetical protein